jgi:integrase
MPAKSSGISSDSATLSLYLPPNYLVDLKASLAKLRLSQVTSDLIEDFKDHRLAEGAGPATVNRDLAVLRRMLKLAERKRFIARSPFVEVEFLEERSVRRRPHIVTFEEEEKILAVAESHIHAITVIQLETGMRPNRETLMLKWEDIDLVNDTIRIRESKTQAGIRSIPLSVRCKAELLAWRNRLGPEFSPYVFPNMRDTTRPLKNIRRGWANTLRAAKIEYFWIYNLRHTFASRLSAAGISDLYVAQMIGHSRTTTGLRQRELLDAGSARRDLYCQVLTIAYPRLCIGFQDRCHQPLGQLSGFNTVLLQSA